MFSVSGNIRETKKAKRKTEKAKNRIQRTRERQRKIWGEEARFFYFLIATTEIKKHEEDERNVKEEKGSVHLDAKRSHLHDAGETHIHIYKCPKKNKKKTVSKNDKNFSIWTL